MSDFSVEPSPGRYPPQVVGLPGRPGVVSAAAAVTWVGATATAAVTLLLAIALLWFAAPLFDAFGAGSDNPRWWVVGVAVVVVALSAVADVVAVFVFRGHRWARWVLIGLSVLAALGGLVSAYYLGPLLVTAAAVAVVVLLLLPEARAWFRAAHAPEREWTH